MASFRMDRGFLRNIFLTGVGAAALQGTLAVVIYPYLSRHLGSREFGYFMLVLSVTNFVIPVFTNAVINSMLRGHKSVEALRLPGFWLTGLTVVAASGVFIATILALIAKPLAVRWEVPVLAIWLPAMAPSAALTMIYYLLRGQLIADLSFGRRALYDGVYCAGLMTVPIGCSLGILGQWWPLLFSVAPLLAGGSLFLRQLSRRALRLTGVDKKAVRQIVSPSTIYFFALIAAWMLRMADRWFLGETGIDGTSIAHYTVAVQAAMLILFPMEQVAGVLTSMFSNVHKLEDISRRQLRRYFASLAAAVAALAIFGPLFGYAYIRLLFGKAYLELGFPVFLVTLTGMAVYLFQMFGRGIILRFRHPWTATAVETGAAVAGLGMMWLLVGALGPFGAAIGRSIGFAIIGVAYFALCQAGLFRRAFFGADRPNIGDGTLVDMQGGRSH